MEVESIVLPAQVLPLMARLLVIVGDQIVEDIFTVFCVQRAIQLGAPKNPLDYTTDTIPFACVEQEKEATGSICEPPEAECKGSAGVGQRRARGTASSPRAALSSQAALTQTAPGAQAALSAWAAPRARGDMEPTDSAGTESAERTGST
jgi:hypothetical protein